MQKEKAELPSEYSELIEDWKIAVSKGFGRIPYALDYHAGPPWLAVRDEIEKVGLGEQVEVINLDTKLIKFVTVMIQNLHIAGRLAKTSLQEAFNTLKKHSYTLSPAGKEQLKQLREARKAKRIGEAIIQNVMPFAPKPPAPKDRD